MHEVLHGLGLAHPHDTGGTSTVMQGVRSDFDDYGDDEEMLIDDELWPLPKLREVLFTK